MQIATERLTLIANTAESLAAEIASPQNLGPILNARIPDSWPPELLSDALPLFLKWVTDHPDDMGWYGWYAVLRGEEHNTLVGGGGFLGYPKEGVTEMGYSMLPEYYGHGFASEMVKALTDWAFKCPDLTALEAEIADTNLASIRIVHKVGFSVTDKPAEPGHRRYSLSRESLPD